MTHFIKLTLSFEETPIWFNIDKITAMEESPEKTILRTDNDAYFIKESVKEIFKLIKKQREPTNQIPGMWYQKTDYE
jgi:uncharacterized protein YlzI (FlbEa/FlbD family)